MEDSDREDCQMTLKILCKIFKFAVLSICMLYNYSLQYSASKATEGLLQGWKTEGGKNRSF